MFGEDTAMRIDLNTQSPAVTGGGKSGKAESSARSSSTRVEPDEARLSLDHARVQALEAQARNYPEVRQDKVEPLQRAVGSGSYRADAGRTAEAMFNEMLAPPAGLR
jgi:flagellar biosynthesis anti-sigma factor FlgM